MTGYLKAARSVPCCQTSMGACSGAGVLQLRCYRELVGVHVLTLALAVVKLTADGQPPEDSVTCAWDADLQEAGMLDRTRRVSRLLAKTRRDELKRIGSGGKTMWKTVPWPETTAISKPEVDGYASRPTTHSRRSSGPHTRERARKSTLAGQSTFVATRDLAALFLADDAHRQDDRLGR